MLAYKWMYGDSTKHTYTCTYTQIEVCTHLPVLFMLSSEYRLAAGICTSISIKFVGTFILSAFLSSMSRWLISLKNIGIFFFMGMLVLICRLIVCRSLFFFFFPFVSFSSQIILHPSGEEAEDIRHGQDLNRECVIFLY